MKYVIRARVFTTIAWVKSYCVFNAIFPCKISFISHLPKLKKEACFEKIKYEDLDNPNYDNLARMSQS